MSTCQVVLMLLTLGILSVAAKSGYYHKHDFGKWKPVANSDDGSDSDSVDEDNVVVFNKHDEINNIRNDSGNGGPIADKSRGKLTKNIKDKPEALDSSSECDDDGQPSTSDSEDLSEVNVEKNEKLIPEAVDENSRSSDSVDKSSGMMMDYYVYDSWKAFIHEGLNRDESKHAEPDTEGTTTPKKSESTDRHSSDSADVL